MTKKLSIIVILAIAFFAVLQCNVFAAETLPEADANGVITLTEDVILTKSINVDKSVTVKLDGYNITRSTENDSAPAFLVNNADVVLTIEGTGNVSSHGPAVWVINGKAILKGGSYTCYKSSTIYAQGNGTIEITGGNYRYEAKDDPSCYVLNLTDGDRTTAKIVVTGGTFEDFDPSNHGSEGSNTNFVKPGYKSVAENGAYKVVEDDEYKFQEALNAGGTVTLTKDLVLTKPAVVTGTVTLDLNGKTISNTTDIWDQKAEIIEISLISVRAGGNLTIIGNGKLAAKENDCHAVAVQGGKLTINGGTYIGNIASIYVPEGFATINGGTYSILQTSKIDGQNGYGFTLNCLDKNYPDKANIVVTGGTYYKYDPSDAGESKDPKSYVAEGYTVYGPDSNENYQVCKHNLVKTDAKAATYTTDGNKEYYTCNVCNNMFKDAAGTQLTNSIEVTIPMLIQVNNSGNASVGDVVVDEAITESGNSSVVELPPVENATSVTVPVTSVEQVVAADKGLVVETKDTIVTLDAKAVEEVAKQAEDATNITIEVTKIEEKTLNKEQKEAIKDKEVAIVLSAKILADGKEISNFNGGKVKVEIPFTPAEGTKGSDYKVYYVDDNGKVTAIPTRYVKGNLVVELEHFSEYVVVKEVANAGAPAPAAPAGNPNEKDNTPKTGAISVIGLVVAMSVIGLAVLRRKD